MQSGVTRLLAVSLGILAVAGNAWATAKPSLMNQPRAAAKSFLPPHAKAGSGVMGALNEKAVGAPALQIVLPDGKVVTVSQQHVARNDRVGSVTWTGSISGAPGDRVVLTRRKGTLAGFISYRGRAFELHPVAGGQYLLFEVQAPEVTRSDVVRVPPGPASARAKGTDAVVGRLSADASPVVQDVLLLYTQAAWYQSGGEAIVNLILSAVEGANASYRDSGVNLTLNPVGLQQTGVGEGANSDATLDALIGSAAVQAERDRLGADIVLLVTDDRDVCGLAYLMERDSVTFAPYAYGLVRSACLGLQTLTHELGHIQGLAHDRETDPDPGAYPYARGFRRCTTDATAFYDIMAYRCANAPQQVRIRTFSSPNIFHMGNPTGIAYEFDPVNAADGARALNLTAATVAAFREPVVVPPPAPSGLNYSSATSHSVSLHWRDNSVTETGFKLYRATGSTMAFVEIASLGANTTSYTDDTVEPATSYAYRIAAFNSAGQTDSSTMMVVVTPPLPPAAPSGLTATVIAYDHVRLAWQSNSPGVSHYIVERSVDGVHYSTMPRNDPWTGDLFFDDRSTEPGRTYYYRVKASGTGGASEPSAAVMVATPPIVPHVPTQVMATNNRGKKAMVSWNESALGPATRYEVRREKFKKKQWRFAVVVASVAAGGSNVIVDASGKGTFRYAVRACNSVGCSEFSTPTAGVQVTK